jgi:hypothetical protein
MAFGASTSRGRSRSRSTESQRRLVRGDSRQGGGGDRVGGRGGSRGGGRRAGHRRWTGSERNLPGTFQRSASGNQGGTTAVNMVEYPRYSGGGSDSMVFTKIESAKHKPILLDG